MEKIIQMLQTTNQMSLSENEAYAIRSIFACTWPMNWEFHNDMVMAIYQL